MTTFETAFIDLVNHPTNPMVREDLVSLLQRRPERYERFRSYLHVLPMRAEMTPELIADAAELKMTPFDLHRRRQTPLDLAAIIDMAATTKGTLNLSIQDGVITVPDGRQFNLAAAYQPAFVHVQEGGSSDELYLHIMDNAEDAAAARASCARGSYRTSGSAEIPPALAAMGGTFFDVLEAVMPMAVNLDYPDDVDNDLEATDEAAPDDSPSP